VRITVDPFINGGAIGFAIAAPIGPIGLLCIRRTLTGGTFAGFACGLGAASADALYAAIAAFALALATAIVSRVAAPLHIVGGLFLIVLGVRTALAHASIAAGPDSKAPRVYFRAFLTTFALTAINPVTIFSFAGIVAGAAFGSQPPTGLRAAQLVCGVFAGSALWFLLLSVAVGRLRRTLTPQMTRAINVASGITITGFGTWTLASYR
jgi:threonine/homoserine/homoserine lactone efflux protein